MKRWSRREHVELTKLLYSLGTMRRKAQKLADSFPISHWPEGVANPITRALGVLMDAEHCIHKERGQ